MDVDHDDTSDAASESGLSTKALRDLCLSENTPQSRSVGDSVPAMSGRFMSRDQTGSLPGSEFPKHNKASDGSLSGASSGPTIPLQDGAGEPGNVEMMAKMMMMMSGEESHNTPDSSTMPKGSVPDRPVLVKGEGMPLPGMMSMMSEGGMTAVMDQGGMKVGPMEMAKLFDCIIELSLARADSDDSEDDEENVAVDLPCPYCSRSFSNQMSLKTHILVAHEQEDDSVLNIKQLVVDSKGRHGNRAGPHRKHSRDIEIAAAEASDIDAKMLGQRTESRGVPTHGALSAAESGNVRGIKRGRTESKESEAAETAGAASVEDVFCEQGDPTPSCAISSMFETGDAQDVHKRKPNLRSRHICKEPASQVKYKKTKSCSLKCDAGDCDKGLDEDSSILDPHTRSLQDKTENEKFKVKGDAKRRATSADRKEESNVYHEVKSSLDQVTGSEGVQASAAAGPSEQAEDSSTTARRSLRCRISRY